MRDAYQRFSVGLDAELRNIKYGRDALSSSEHRLHLGAGPSVGVLAVDDGQFRIEGKVAWMPLATTMDFTRICATVEFSWRSFTVRALGGTSELGSFRATPPLVVPHFGFYLGWRHVW